MRNYLAATTYLCDIVEDDIKDGHLNFPESTFADSILGYSQGIKIARFESPISLGNDDSAAPLRQYQVEEHTAIYLVGLALQIDEFFDYCARIAGHNIAMGAYLPKPLRYFSEGVLTGRISRPAKRSRPRKKNWMERNFIWSITLDAKERFGLALLKDPDLSNSDSACHAVAEALTICGRKTGYDEIKRLMVHSENARLRAEFEAAKRIFFRWEQRPVPRNALSPVYAPFWENAAREDVLDILGTFPVTGRKKA